MIKKNRRCRNLTHKKYRRYRCDLWGRLALKRRNNFITNLICDYNVLALKKRLRSASPKMRFRLKRFFSPVFQQKLRRKAAYQINIQAVQRRVRPNSQRGILLRLRRQISLYYSGGRIRSKTYRRFSRLIAERKPAKPMFITSAPINNYRVRQTFASVFESRLDALLLRSNFVDSVYRARYLIYNHKCKVEGLARVTDPGVSLRIYQPFMLNRKDTAILRYHLRKRIEKSKTFLTTPSYLFVDYIKTHAFLIEYPLTHLVGFSFSEDLGALASFRKSFRML